MSFISGRVTLDQNRDFTERDGSGGFDPGIEGVVVQLLNEAGQVIATTTTDATGRYTFDGLANGFYALQPALFIQIRGKGCARLKAV